MICFILAPLARTHANDTARSEHTPLSIGTTLIRTYPTSLKTLRTEGVVIQGKDFSCGAAALATIFTYHFNDPVTENELLDILTKQDIDTSHVMVGGLSMLDLKGISLARGYKANGYRVTLDHLKTLHKPVIIHYRPRDFEHFAVLKQIANNRAYISDPVRGNVSVPLWRFQEEWGGVILSLTRLSDEIHH